MVTTGIVRILIRAERQERMSNAYVPRSGELETRTAHHVDVHVSMDARRNDATLDKTCAPDVGLQALYRMSWPSFASDCTAHVCLSPLVELTGLARSESYLNTASVQVRSTRNCMLVEL